MKKLPKPVKKIRDLIGGTSYFAVIGSVPGQMWIEGPFVILGRPFKDNDIKRFCVRYLYKYSTLEMWEGILFLADRGIVEKGEVPLNKNRLFKYNMKDYFFIKELIKKQDKDTYLRIIG
jgi:hypothetical protein